MQGLCNYFLGLLYMNSCFAFSGRLIKYQPISIPRLDSTFQVHDPGPQ